MESRENSARKYFATTLFGTQHFDRTHTHHQHIAETATETEKPIHTYICGRGVMCQRNNHTLLPETHL